MNGAPQSGRSARRQVRVARPAIIFFERSWAYAPGLPPEAETITPHPNDPENIMTEINKDEKVVVAKSDIVAKSDFNVANVIAAIALLMLVLGALKYMGVSPI